MRLRTARHPLLYEINARVWAREVARPAKRGKTSLADVPDRVLDELADLGFDAVWLMGVWQVGSAGVRIAREHPHLRQQYARTLPDWSEEDVIGSPYAVQNYRVARELGGGKALASLRRRLARRGVALILDFVPNHTAIDYPWVYSHPEFYVAGTAELRRREPENYFVAETARGPKILAHGRDPHFSGWTDTAQLDYRHPAVRDAMVEVLRKIATQCDSVRCDMAMLQLEEVFRRTWGEPAGLPQVEGEFWVRAIDVVRRQHPGFLFLAEAYWEKELELQALGFDYTYDKRLCDLLLQRDAGAVRGHLAREPEFQRRSVRFLENHDEARIAAVLPLARHRAAAVACYAAPGMRLFHEGQLEGRTVHLPIQLRRRPQEAADRELEAFYRRLLQVLQQPCFRHGQAKPLQPRAASEGNSSWRQFIAFRWDDRPRGSCLCVINYSAQPGQCYLSLELPGFPTKHVRLRDLLQDHIYLRPADSLVDPGLYLHLEPYQAHIFALESAP